ncbi:MAG: hypothetical protein H6515_14645 [Microthrixaceae bacterium]|nr:hypothetical protein [Microthrixaceae bacterium]
MVIGVVADTRAAEQMLTNLIDRVDNPRQILGLLGDELQAHQEEAFASRGHGSWAANNPATMRAKGHGRVLVDTGALMADLTRPRIDGEKVGVDSDSIGGRMAARGARGAPRRDPTPTPTPADVRGWAERVLQHITRGH